MFVKGIDVLNNTPLIDIKSYVPGFGVKRVDEIGMVGNKSEGLCLREITGLWKKNKKKQETTA